jgi:hypothetical protein
MGKKNTMFIKMLGNHREYEFGKVYEVDYDTGNNLTGIGIAIEVEAPAASEPSA